MDLIPSFSVDHTAIVPGIFTSRADTVGGGTVTTYDVRLTRPNREPAVDVAAMHSLEHLIATFLRNDPDWKDEVIYWGPMGCLTGFYLILKGSRPPREIFDLILRAFRSVQAADSVPGATEQELRPLPDAQPGHGQVVRGAVRGLPGRQRRQPGDLRVSPDGAPRHRGRTALLRFVSGGLLFSSCCVPCKASGLAAGRFLLGSFLRRPPGRKGAASFFPGGRKMRKRKQTPTKMENIVI